MDTPADAIAPFAHWLLDSLGSALVAVDADARLVLLNGEALRILASQHPAEEENLRRAAAGRPCAEVLATQPTLCARLLDALHGGECPGRAELVLESEGPEAATIGYSLVAIRDPEGAIRGAALQFRDLTPIERRAARERLRERLVALGEMAAGLAHEIRNPLAAMEISAGLLKRQIRDDPDALDLVEDLRGEVARVAETVHQSLEFVRPVALEPEPTDAAALLEEALRLARARSAYRGQVERELPETPLPPLLVDVDGVRAVLANLMLNACEALEDNDPADQRLTIGASAAADRDEIALWIADNGPGISAEHRERIFYPFFTTKQNGSGVGLAIAQKLVAEHGGRVELESAPGAGARFRVHLPCVRDGRDPGSGGRL